MVFLARIVRIVAAVVIGLIVVGIVLHLVGANSGNSIVSTIYDAAGWLTSPFHNVFSIHDAKGQIAANWGLAAVVYAIVAALLTRLLLAMGTAGGGWYRRGPGPATP